MGLPRAKMCDAPCSPDLGLSLGCKRLWAIKVYVLESKSYFNSLILKMVRRSYNAAMGKSNYPVKRMAVQRVTAKRTYTKKKTVKSPKVSALYLSRLIDNRLIQRAEKKEFINYGANQSLVCASGGLTPAYINLMPALVQGTGASQRIGNEVKVVNGWFRLAINLLPYNAVSNPNPGPLYAKVWILYPVAQQFTTLSGLTPSIASTMFKIGNGNTGPQGNMLDMVLPVNDNLWKVLQVQQKRIGVTNTNATGPASTASWMDNSTMSQTFEFDITRHIGTLQYNDTTSNDPTNKSLFAVMQVVGADGTNMGTLTPAEYHFSFCIQYVDM